jgi:hypothetical protein
MAFEFITVFTPQEKAFLDQLKRVVPKPFLNTCEDPNERDFKLLGIASLALGDYANMPPCEHGLTFNNLPPDLVSLIVLGTNYYIMMFRQAEFSLIDISYSDNGLSVNLDRVTKIGQVMDTFEKMWLRQIQNRKNCLLLSNGGFGLRTARYQSNFSRFVGMLGTGGAFGWNMP